MFLESKNNKSESNYESKSEFIEQIKKFYPVAGIILTFVFLHLHAKNNNKNLKYNEKIKNIFDNNEYDIPHVQETESLEQYISEEKISKNIIKLNDSLNKLKDSPEINRKFKNEHISSWSVVSSERKFNKNTELTELEKALDKAVDNGDLPIKQFTLSQIENVYKEKTKNYKSDTKSTIETKKGIDALELYKHAQDGAVVQVASQYNSLESISDHFSPVKNWINDITQGPRCSLQAIISSKHRESAYLKHKLPDSIKKILDSCKIQDSTINEKYNIYNDGYLKLYNIGENSTDDLKILKKHIEENIGNFGLNAQWVICENGKKQFQLFLAAPSFQNVNLNWNKDDDYTDCLKKICKTLVVAQYKASAQIAVIKSIVQNKQIELHVTKVGQGAFNNPKEVMKDCLDIINKNVKDYNVKVIIHEHC